jgi:hypothetical protein
MLKSRDMHELLKARKTNLILAVPTLTVLLPTLLAFPMSVPPVLAIPHVVYLIMFLVSIFAYLRHPK